MLLNTNDFAQSNPKYMIDMSAYRTLHVDTVPAPDPDRENLSSLAMDREEPPEDPFVLLLPASVKGFGFHDKKWRKCITSRPVEYLRSQFQELSRYRT